MEYTVGDCISKTCQHKSAGCSVQPVVLGKEPVSGQTGAAAAYLAGFGDAFTVLGHSTSYSV